MLAERALLLTTASAIRVRSASDPCVKTCAIHVRSMCDPPAILVRSECFLRDPGEVRPIFYKRSGASTYPFYNTKGEVVLLGVVFTSLSPRPLVRVLTFFIILKGGGLAGCCFYVPVRPFSRNLFLPLQGLF